jgi:4-hydroxybenzoyl-CoA reductase subunit beta
MRLPDFQYVEPKSIEEACAFLKEHAQESKLIAGGTDLLPSMKQRIFKPKYVVNLGVLPNLDRIEFDEKAGLRLGGLVKLRSLETDAMIRKHYPMIGQAAEAVGSVQLRQMGTVGGNLSLDTRCYYYNQSDFWRKCRPVCIKMGGETCNAVGGGKKCFAVFSGDLAPALVALGAKIVLRTAKGERSLPLSEYYSGDGAKPLSIGPEEVLTRVEVPVVPKGAYGSYQKYRIRKSIDFPLAGVGALVVLEGKEKVCREARVVIGAVGMRPEEVKGIGELLKGKKMTESLIEEASEMAFKMARPVANAASTPTYRKRMVKILVKRALQQGVGGKN